MEEKDKAEILNNKYIRKRFLGQGTFGAVFLVKEIKTNKKYVIKESKLINDKTFINEINMLNLLSEKNIKNDYIVKKIENWNEEKNGETKQYIVFDYAKKKDLFRFFRFFKYTERKFKDIYIKLIYSKILNGVQAIHDSGICHLDLKLNNILLDEKFNPIICDFGLSTLLKGVDNSYKLTKFCGTKAYKAPEIFKRIPFDGIKADIFSLGGILFNLVINKYIYHNPTKDILEDRFYKLIIEKNYELFWKTIETSKPGLEISNEFKDILEKIVSYNPDERPSIEEILKAPWMNEINNLTKEEKDKLEKKYQHDLEELYDDIKEFNRLVFNESESKTTSKNDNKSIGGCYIQYFDEDCKINNIDENEIDMEKYIKIKGNLNPKDFMNTIANKVKEIKYDDDNDNDNLECPEIEESKDYFKFNLRFKNEEEDEEDEDEENNPEELKEDKDINKGDVIIEFKLFKSKDCYLLRIIKVSGETEEYYEKYEKIRSMFKALYN